MKFNKIYILILVFSSLFFISCEKKTDWDIKSSEKTFLIVDGIITNEHREHTISLSLSFPEHNVTPQKASDAVVFVTNYHDTIRFFESSLDPGLYIAEEEFSAVINNQYKLDITYESETFFAIAGIVPVIHSSFLSVSSDNDSGLYFIDSETAVFNPDDAAMYEISVDWSHLPGYETLPEDSTSAKQYFYSLTTLDVNEIFAPAHERVFFPKGSILIHKKYSLTPNHEKFIRSLLIETQWNGGNFDIEEGNVYTNLSDGALGFFAASSVVTDTIVVE